MGSKTEAVFPLLCGSFRTLRCRQMLLLDRQSGVVWRREDWMIAKAVVFCYVIICNPYSETVITDAGVG